MEEDCRAFGRVAGTATVAMTATAAEALAGKQHALAANCEDATCMKVEAASVSVRQADGTMWIERDGQPPAIVQAPPMPLVQRAPPVDAARTPLPPEPADEPELPPEYRTCGRVHAGGGSGWNVVKNDGNVWQRVEWVMPPTSPHVLALKPGDYPLPKSDGSLCGWAHQREPRNWVFTFAGTTVAVETAPDREHPPVHCGNNDTISIETAEGWSLFGASGGASGGAARIVHPEAELSSAVAKMVTKPGPAINVRIPDGTPGGAQHTVSLPRDTDLAGGRLPEGATRIRIAMVGDGEGHLLVAERFQAKGCRWVETLSMLDLVAGTAKALRTDDVVFSRLSYGLKRFFWLESEPQIIDVSEG